MKQRHLDNTINLDQKKHFFIFLEIFLKFNLNLGI